MAKSWDDLSNSRKGDIYWKATGRDPYFVMGHSKRDKYIEEHEPFACRVWETHNKLSAIHKAQYKLYLKSDEWKRRVVRVLERDNFTCRVCGARIDIQVHHLTYDRKYNESDYDLIAVCGDCHKAIHAYDHLE